MEEREMINGIPTRILGQTGARLTILGVGGYHIASKKDADLGVRIVRTAIDEGVNFLDNAWCYNDGESERIMGLALRDGYRDKVFLMTKNHGRDGDTFRRQLGESLRRLQTDHIDLLLFHCIDKEGETERLFSEGAIEAAVAAREGGRIRFIGFSVHQPLYARELLAQGFPWDAVLMPFNLMDTYYDGFSQEVVPLLKERGIGILGMKSLAFGKIFRTGISAREAISNVLSLPITTLVSGVESLENLAENLEIARTWEPLSAEERDGLLARCASWSEEEHDEGKQGE